MSKATSRPVRVLELRSVRGTGGGPEKTILLGAARTDPSHYAVTVCYLRDRRDDVFHIDGRAQGLNIDYVEIQERHSFDTGIWGQLRALVRERRIDIVHAHDYKTDLLALLLARVEPLIPLATAHGWSGYSFREQRIYYPADRWLLARYPHVIAVSSKIRDALIGAGASPDKVSVILNGIDHEVFRRQPAWEQDARERFGFAPGDVVVGAVGSLEPVKNFRLLVAAFGRLAREIPHARLVIAGDGSLRRDLGLQIQELGLEERCTLLGQTGDVASLHHALDLFVQSSDSEGAPNAVLEAMAFSTPIVATAAGGTAELAREGVDAIIVPPRNEESLFQALREALLDRDAAQRRAASARRRVETDLAFATRMRAVESLYDLLAARYPWKPRSTGVGRRRIA